VEEDLIHAAYENNPDGFGVMMPVGRGKIHVHKILPKKWEDCWNTYQKYVGKPIALHFRLNTQGDTDKANCHPFKVLSKKQHGRDCWLMHNGPYITSPSIDVTKSDTWHFVEYILKPILVRNPDLLEDTVLLNILENLAIQDRLTILDGKKETFLNTNFDDKDVFDGLALSNTYSLHRGIGLEYDPATGVSSFRNKNSYTSSNYVYGFGGANNYYDQYDTYADCAGPLSKEEVPVIMDVFESILKAMNEGSFKNDNPVRLEIESYINLDNEAIDLTFEDIDETGQAFKDAKMWEEDKNNPDFVMGSVPTNDKLDVFKLNGLDKIKEMSESELYDWVTRSPEEACDVLTEIL
jgi:hypothetical protein